MNLKFSRLTVIFGGLGLCLAWVGGVRAQLPEPVYRCDLVTAQQPVLRVTDDASGKGALISNVRLITLHNGLKALAFSATYADRFASTGGPRKLRFSVSWSDDCGRPVSMGSSLSDGFVLNPGQQVTRQSVAPSGDASVADVRFYVESPPLLDPYQQ